MARVTSLFICLSLFAAGFGQFGRFGYNPYPDFPGLRISASCLQAKDSLADKLSFLEPLGPLKVTVLTDRIFDASLKPVFRGPDRIVCDLAHPAMRLHYIGGMAFQIATTSSPYISWPEGSVRDGVSTPKCPWVLVSFSDNQPPIWIGFEGAPQSLKIEGKPGAWILKTGMYEGWVRFGVPLGTEGRATRTAGSLGDLCKTLQAQLGPWLAPPAKLDSVVIDDTLLGLKVTWHYDRAGVRVPPALLLAPPGGYPLRLESQIQRVEGFDEDGPLAFTTEKDLTAYFPARRIPTGRFLVEGIADPGAPVIKDSGDIAGIVETGLSNLMASREPSLIDLGEREVNNFISETPFTKEPFTSQDLPFKEDGTGLDVVAAHALLLQCLTTTRQASSEANSLISTALQKRDWLTWRMWSNQPEVSRRAGGLLAVACAMCPEPERRLEGVLQQAALAAERGLAIYHRRIGNAGREPEYLETLYGIRKQLYVLNGRGYSDPFASALLSEVRVVGTPAVSLERGADGLVLHWNTASSDAGTFALIAAYPVGLEGLANLAGVQVEEALGTMQIRYRPTAAGICSLKFMPPTWAKPLPTSCPAPKFAEPRL